MKTIFICSNCFTVENSKDELITNPVEIAKLLYLQRFHPNEIKVLTFKRCPNCKKINNTFERGGW